MSQKQGLLGYCSVYYFHRIDLKSVIDSEFDYHGYQSLRVLGRMTVNSNKILFISKLKIINSTQYP